MGYTHYWTHKRRFTLDQWGEITGDVTTILATAATEGLQIGDWAGESAMSVADVFSEDPDEPGVGPVFGFNGLGEDAHETFYIHRDRTPDYDYRAGRYILPRAAGKRCGRGFCKTARKPYDVAVTAILCYLESCYDGALVASSDGNAPDWREGLALAKRALPSKGNVLQMPFDVRWDSQFVFDREMYGIGSEKYWCEKRVDGVILLGKTSAPYKPLAYVPAARAETFIAAAKRRFKSVPTSCYGVEDCRRMTRKKDAAMRDLLTYNDVMQGAPETIPEFLGTLG